jgi:sugar phosphate isomerase/epimerase
MTRIGAHLHDGDPLAEAQAIGADAVQFFLGDPQGWKAPTFPGEPAEIGAAFAAAGIDAYVHSPYVINVASPNNRIRIPSRKLLEQQLKAAASIGAKGLIVHGGHVTAGVDPEEGYDSWRKAIERIERPLPMLIENTAGGDGAMARGLDAIARLWDAIGSAADSGGGEVGFCLDTCHAFASGGPGDHRGADQGHHWPDRPGALQQLARRVRVRPGPARRDRGGHNRSRAARRGGAGCRGNRHLRDTRSGRRCPLAPGEAHLSTLAGNPALR